MQTIVNIAYDEAAWKDTHGTGIDCTYGKSLAEIPADAVVRVSTYQAVPSSNTCFYSRCPYRQSALCLVPHHISFQRKFFYP